MICPNCNSFTNSPKGHSENLWACVSVLKERNLKLENEIEGLKNEVAELKADLHATEALLELEMDY